ncbi:hypothetical protein [Microtetraspora niveoalba]|uniref:hypothetical protein n=1 Tax=Microtetraspora niveoalba TaxID=46175 RepID=UPI00082B29DF|nr:hypothetical protein [Microtetraspora niveoalba]
MRVHRDVRFAAAALAGCLMAAACAPSRAEPRFEPAGGPAATAAESTPGAVRGTPEPSITPGVERVSAGDGLRVEIEWPSGLDADVVGGVRMYAESYTATWRAVTSGGRDTAYVHTVEETALRDAATRLRSFLDRRMSARGVARLYALRVDSKVEIGDRMGVQVLGCVDESGVRMTDQEGNPVADQPGWTRPPLSTYLWVAAVGRDEQGVWRVRTFRIATYPSASAKRCAR